LVARLVLGRRAQETGQRGRPESHALELLVQAIERLDEITGNKVFRLGDIGCCASLRRTLLFLQNY
jgi:hypothetical protein